MLIIKYFDCNENIEEYFKKEKAMMKRMVQKRGLRKKQVIFLGLLVFFFAAGEVTAAQKAPSRFHEVAGSNGSVLRDRGTKLEWQRCAYGQSWTGSGCSGTPWEGTWDNAVKLTYPGGFRLPILDELKTLGPYYKSVFSGAYRLWSSTYYEGYKSIVWGFNFDYGNGYGYSKNESLQVRLVRVGQ
jgi:hypothetical protein